jgi:ferrochelatase
MTPRYRPAPPHRHDTAPAIGVLLLNLGTPAAPTPAAVRRYLREFLGDPRVVELPRLLWKLILETVILPFRPRRSAAKYASIWTEKGSPLAYHTQRQAALLQSTLERRGLGVDVDWAMRYGTPGVDTVLSALEARAVRRLLVLPLYPQYAASTSASAMDAVSAWLMRTRNLPELRSVRSFADHPGYIAALAETVEAHWRRHGRPGADGRLLLSFHGLPRKSLERGDPYFCECQKTARLLAERLALPPTQYQVAFQSRFGRAEWLAPYTSATLKALADQGVRRVDVLCPGFVADCLETLEEIALEGRQDFLCAGGREYHYIPALNDQPLWIEALADLVESHLAGWPPTPPDEARRIETANRARALGARN